MHRNCPSSLHHNIRYLVSKSLRSADSAEEYFAPGTKGYNGKIALLSLDIFAWQFTFVLFVHKRNTDSCAHWFQKTKVFYLYGFHSWQSHSRYMLFGRRKSFWYMILVTNVLKTPGQTDVMVWSTRKVLSFNGTH